MYKVLDNISEENLELKINELDNDGYKFVAVVNNKILMYKCNDVIESSMYIICSYGEYCDYAKHEGNFILCEKKKSDGICSHARIINLGGG